MRISHILSENRFSYVKAAKRTSCQSSPTPIQATAGSPATGGAGGQSDRQGLRGGRRRSEKGGRTQRSRYQAGGRTHQSGPDRDARRCRGDGRTLARPRSSWVRRRRPRQASGWTRFSSPYRTRCARWATSLARRSRWPVAARSVADSIHSISAVVEESSAATEEMAARRAR
jgi:hypothetical protein